tara:strand:+ start:212 stop:499 length:288 start_codon:yes stop_codon:yes gene_type:complete
MPEKPLTNQNPQEQDVFVKDVFSTPQGDTGLQFGDIPIYAEGPATPEVIQMEEIPIHAKRPPEQGGEVIQMDEIPINVDLSEMRRRAALTALGKK